MKKRNIVLIGFMAAGKTTISKVLSEKLNMDIVATDDVIVARENLSINDIFKNKGEKYFRSLERDIVREYSKKDNVIFDCGGGIILNPDNIKDLKKNGVMIYLKASPELILGRVKLDDTRPLMQVKEPLARINELLKEREPLYSSADFTVLVDNKTFETVADEIIKVIKK